MYNQFQLKDLVERAIGNLSLNMGAEKLFDPVRYVLSIGGKRLRPVLSLMACNLFNDKIDNAVMPAAGIEVFHNFTLVHDDIMDNAPLRRNLPTVHSKWNMNQSILSGDVMAFLANDCFLQAPPSCMEKVFRVFNKAAIDVCIGQQQDMNFEKIATVSREEYLQMIELKTAVLIAASAKIGGIIGGAGEEDAAMLYNFGRSLGLAFQLQDDLLDLYGDVKVFGKISGGDISANKKTFLYVRALETASASQQKRLHELFSDVSSDQEEKVTEVASVYDKLGVKEATEQLVSDYFSEAMGFLERTVVAAERKDEIIQLTGTLIGREK
jgi:geranylgeranyl diphosphate synthase type II